MADPALCSPAWRLRGIGYDPGALTLADDRLSFRTEEGMVFDVPLAEVSKVVAPWYYFGGGLKLSVGDERYRFSFVAPNGAPPVSRSLLPPGAVGRPWVFAGRDAGREWREALGV
ncbi:MAG: hypothetical protein AAF791_08335 [Bacteroidota bacterium]